MQNTEKNTEKNAENHRHKTDAFDRAAAWLSARPRTEWEVRKYLRQKEYDASETDDAVGRLLEYGYLDDLQYCQSYIRTAAAKGKGRRRMENDLAARGISRSVMEDAFCRVEEEDAGAGADASPLDEKKRALEVAVKMTRQQLESGKLLDEKYFARVGRRLAGLGYTTDVIYFVIGKLRGIKTK